MCSWLNNRYSYRKLCCRSLPSFTKDKKKSAMHSVTTAHLIASCFSLQDGETPLLRATQKNHTAIVSLLLEKGASVSVADRVSILISARMSVQGNIFLDIIQIEFSSAAVTKTQKQLDKFLKGLCHAICCYSSLYYQTCQ